MPYAIELIFEDPGSLAVQALRDRAAAAGLPSFIEQAGWRASIPLAVFGQMDATSMRLEMKRYAMALKPFELDLSGVAFACDMSSAGLTPTMTPELDQAHKMVHNFLRKAVQSPRPDYFPGRWTPTVALGEGYSQLLVQRMTDQSAEWGLPVRVIVSDACVVNVNPSRRQTVFQVQLATGAFRDRS